MYPWWRFEARNPKQACRWRMVSGKNNFKSKDRVVGTYYGIGPYLEGRIHKKCIQMKQLYLVSIARCATYIWLILHSGHVSRVMNQAPIIITGLRIPFFSHGDSCSQDCSLEVGKSCIFRYRITLLSNLRWFHCFNVESSICQFSARSPWICPSSRNSLRGIIKRGNG